MSEVKKVIKVFEDGAYEDVEHGVYRNIKEYGRRNSM